MNFSKKDRVCISTKLLQKPMTETSDVKNELTSNEPLACDKKSDSINSQNAKELPLNEQALNPLVFHQAWLYWVVHIFISNLTW